MTSHVKQEEARIMGIVDRLSPLSVPPGKSRATWDRSHTTKFVNLIFIMTTID